MFISFGMMSGLRVFNLLFLIFFFLMFGILFGMIVKHFCNSSNSMHREWGKVDPTIIVPAAVVAKRTYVATEYSSSRTRYYVTFEVESGDRIEFNVDASHYGLMAEDDVGKLTFQGRKFVCFERKQAPKN